MMTSSIASMSMCRRGGGGSSVVVRWWRGTLTIPYHYHHHHHHHNHSRQYHHRLSMNLEPSPPAAALLRARVKFSHMVNDDEMVQRLHTMGMESPTDIQMRTMPVLENQRPGDVVCVRSETGSGKTIAVMLPIITALGIHKHQDHHHQQQQQQQQPRRSPDVLVLVPSRELAVQTYTIVQQLLGGVAASEGVVSMWLGGESVSDLANAFARAPSPPRIIIAQAKPAAEIIYKSQRVAQSMCALKYIVLDEADSLLRPPPTRLCLRQRRKFLRHPRPAQVVTSHINAQSTSVRIVVVSAVINARLRGLLVRHGWLRPGERAVVVDVGAPTLFLPPSIEHRVVLVSTLDHRGPEYEKYRDSIVYKNDVRRRELLRDLLKDAARTPRVMVVVNCDNSMEPWAELVHLAGRRVALLHEHIDNFSAMYGDFQRGTIDVLLCTAESVRGMDFPFLSHVMLMDVPKDEQAYLHLSGRVGRMRKQGTVVTFVKHARDKGALDRIARFLGINFEEF